MQKLQALHRILLALAKELEREAASLQDVSTQLLPKALALLQPSAMNPPVLEIHSCQMPIKPVIRLNIQENSLKVDCNLSLTLDAGKRDIIIKPLPSFTFSLTDTNGHCLSGVKKTFQEFTKSVDHKNGTDLTNPYRSLAEFKFFIALLHVAIAD